MTKASKSEVEYRYVPFANERCSNCRHFDPPDLCKIVLGIVSPKGHCRKFDEPEPEL